MNSGGSINRDEAFTTGQYTFTLSLPLTDDEIALEDVESYNATLTLAPGTPPGVVLGSQTTTTISVKDNDGESVCVHINYVLKLYLFFCLYQLQCSWLALLLILCQFVRMLDLLNSISPAAELSGM